MAKDYYEILGISKSATDEEIKRAFRKLAHQHHPDKKGGDEAKFKEINEAYQVLSNKEKRAQYDQFGTTFEDAARGGAGFSYQDFSRGGAGFSWDDIFGSASPFGRTGRTQQAGYEDFDFGDIGDIFGDIFGLGRRSPRQRRKKRGSDIEMQMEIDFREAVFGAEKIIELYKNVVCSHCSGSGHEAGTRITNCSKCGGIGQVEQIQSTFLGRIRTVGVCPVCQGEGKIAKDKCKKCRGQGYIKDTKKIKIKIPAGIDNGQSIRLAGEGEAGSKGSNPGDLYVVIRVREDSEFERKGNDIYTRQEISFSQAALGDKIKINTLDGEVMLKISSGTQSGKIFRLRDKGVPYLQNRGRGDQLVEIIVKTPERLSRKAKQLFEELAQDED